LDNKEKLAVTGPTTPEKMRMVAHWLHDKKGRHVTAMDVAELSTVTEGLVLCTAGSVRHAKALADHVLDMAAENDMPYLGMEGYKTSGARVLQPRRPVERGDHPRPGPGRRRRRRRLGAPGPAPTPRRPLAEEP